MTRLERLYTEQRQSPWLDNLTRPYLRDGTLAAFVADGIRGVTANPTILAKAIEGSDAYDAQFAATHRAGLCRSGMPIGNWPSRTSPMRWRCCVRPSTTPRGDDGFVSIEVAPELARDTEATIAAACPPARADRPPQPVGEGSRHRRGHPGDRGVDRQGVEHQHHPDLLAVSLRAGDRRLPARSGNPHRTWW